MERAALLVRVSDERQAGDDRHSLPAQLAALREHSLRQGWEIVREFVAAGESASTNELDARPVLRDIVAGARKGEFDILLYHESSRLARDEEMAQWLLNRCIQWGVRLVNASKDIDYTTSDGRFMYAIDSGLDAYWRRKMSEHIRKGKDAAFAKGLPIGVLPVGYRRNGRAIELVADEAEAIRVAFKARGNGASYQECCAIMHRAGVRPRSRRGYEFFTTSSMQSLLENDFYAGFVRHKGDRTKGKHPTVINEDEWLAAQTIVSRVTRRISHTTPLLAGLATCFSCDGPLWVTTTGNGQWAKPSYREASRFQYRECDASGKMWRASAPDGFVSAAVRGFDISRDWLEQAINEAQKAPREQGALTTRVELEARKGRAGKAFVAGALSEPELHAELARIEAALRALPIPLEQVKAAATMLTKFSRVWDAMLQEERREACRIIFKGVKLDTLGKEVYLMPAPDYLDLFSTQARSLCVDVPPAGIRGSHSTQALFTARELVAA